MPEGSGELGAKRLRKGAALRRKRTPGLMPLEPRLMYDGAAAITAMSVVNGAHAAVATHAALSPHPVGDAAPSDHAAVTPSTAPSDHAAVTPSAALPPDTSHSLLAAAATGATIESGAPSAHASSAAGSDVQQIVFIDGNVPDAQLLASGVQPGVKAVILDPNSDGVQQIATYLQQNDVHGLSAISIVAHGTTDELALGNALLTAGDAPSYAAQMAVVGQALKPGGDLMLYGCDVAQVQNDPLLGELASETGGATVAAASHLVGAAAEGGSWNLDISTGTVAAATPFTAATLQAYPDLLTIPSDVLWYTAQDNQDGADTTVSHIDVSGSTGTNVQNVISDGSSVVTQLPTSIAIDAAQGYYFFVDQQGVNTQSGTPFTQGGAQFNYEILRGVIGSNAAPTVIYTSGSGTIGGVVDGADSIQGLTFDAANGQLYFTQADSDAGGATPSSPTTDTGIYTIGVNGAQPGTAQKVLDLNSLDSSDRSQFPDQIAVDAPDNLLFFTSGVPGASVNAVEVATLTSSTSATLTNDHLATYSVSGTQFAAGIAVDAANDKLYWTTRDSGSDAGNAVYGASFSVATLGTTGLSGTTRLFQGSSGGLLSESATPYDIAIDATAGVFYLDTTPDTTTGSATLVEGSLAGSGSLHLVETLPAPSNVIIDSNGVDLEVQPVVVANGTITDTEGQAANTIDAGVTVSTTNDARLDGAAVQITNFQSGDVLGVGSGSGFTVNGSQLTFSDGDTVSFSGGSTGTLTFTGVGTALDYQHALSAVTFSSTSTNVAARTIDWTVNDGLVASGTATSTVDMGPALVAGSTATFDGGGIAQALDSGLVVGDGSSGTLASATISIASGFIAGDTLNFTNNGSEGNIAVQSDANGQLVLTSSGATATVAEWQTALRNVTYSFAPTNGDPTTASRTIDWVVTDGTLTSTLKTSTLDTVHTAPTVNASGTVSFDGGGSAVTLDSTATVTDPDSSGNLASATVSITTGFTAGDTLAVAGITNGTVAGTNISVNYDSATGQLTLSGSDTITHYDTVLGEVQYSFSPANGDPTVGGSHTSRGITWSANDGSTSNGASNTATSTLDTVHVAPQLTLGTPSANYFVGGSGTVLDSGLQVADVDSNESGSTGPSTLSSATITISSGFLTGDSLSVDTTGTNIAAVAFNATTHQLVLTGSDTVAHYQQVLDSVAFSSTSADPTNGGADTSRTISWLVNDGNTTNATASGTTSLGVHLGPDITAGATATYDAGASPVALDSALTVSESAVTDLASATVTIGSGFLSGDQLNFANTANISGSYNSATGLLTLSGSDTVANYQAALDSITFSSTAGDPTNAGGNLSRTITWTASDGTHTGSATSTVDVRTPPAVSAGTPSVTFTANGTAVTADGGVTLADLESTSLTGATVTISSGFVSGDTLHFNAQNGIIGAFSGDTLTLSGTASLAFYQSALQSITFSTSGSDITSGGTDHARTLTWQVSDGLASSNAPTTSLTVVQPPVVSAGTPSVSYIAGSSATLLDTGLTVTDAEATQLSSATVSIANAVAGDTLSFNNGTNAETFASGTINAVFSGTTLTLSGTADVSDYVTALHEVSFTSSSTDPTAGGSNTSRTIDWSVTDTNGSFQEVSNTAATSLAVHTPPVVSAGTPSVTFTAGGSPVTVDGGLTLVDVDSATLSGATVTIGSGFTSGDTLNFSAQNGITGLFSGNTLTLSGTATIANYQAALESITFGTSSTSTTDVSRTIDWTVADAFATSATAATAVTVHVAPTAGTVTVGGGVEGVTAATLSAGFTDSNAGASASDFSGTIAWGDGTASNFTSAEVSGSNGSFTVSGLSHQYAEEGAFTASVTINDADGGSVTETGSTTVADAALTAGTATVIGGVEGGAPAALTATFTDANLNAPTSDFSGTIAWGDGTGVTPFSSANIIANGNGSFTVTGVTHQYAEEGTYGATVVVFDRGGSSTTISGTANIADAPLNAGTVSLTGGVEGGAAANLSATFTDANSNAPTSDFSGTIAWGDGTTTNFTSAEVSGSNGSFAVSGLSHVYAEEGAYTASVSIHDVGGSSTTEAGSTTVADAALTAGTVSLTGGVEGGAAANLSATFADANLNAPASDFSGIIAWGDGTTSNFNGAEVSGSNGSFTVNGLSHVYAEEGAYTTSVSIHDIGGSSVTEIGSTTVADAALTAGTATVTGSVEGGAAATLNATFTDANLNAPVSDFSGMINWGDGTTTNFTSAEVSGSNGSFAVSGLSHVYVADGNYTTTVTINDVGGSTTTDTGTATVADAPLTAGTATVTGGAAGTTAAMLSATFSDANAFAPTSDFSGTVDWGDGSTTSFTSAEVSGSGGSFTVSGSHLYSLSGSYTTTVTIDDAGGSTTTDIATATVTHVAPTMAAGGTVSFDGGGGPVPLDSTASVTDVDSSSLQSATVSIASGFVSGDTLSANGVTNGTVSGIAVSYDSVHGVLTLSGSASINTYNTVLDEVAYSFNPANGDPTGGGSHTSRTIDWSANDGDAGNGASNTAISTLDTVHVAPAVTAGGTQTFHGGDASAVLDSGLTLTDGDSNGSLTGATVTIASGLQAGDTLAFNNGTNSESFADGATIAAAYSGGKLTLSTSAGAASIADYQSALQSVTFSESPGNTDPTGGGGDTSRTIDWVVSDGSTTNGTSNTATSTLDTVHTAPDLAAGGITTFSSSSSPTPVLLDSGLQLSDMDSGGTIASATVSVGTGFLSGDGLSVDGITTGLIGTTNITASYNAGAGRLTLTGIDTVANYQSVMRAVEYSFTGDPSNGGTDPGRIITWTVNDGSSSNGVSTATSTLVTNGPPPILSGTAGETAEFVQQQGSASVLDSAITLSDSDHATLAGATVSLSGVVSGDTLAADTAGTGIAASYNSGTGVLTLSGTDTVGDYQAVLRSVTYSSAAADPTGIDATRTVNVNWQVDDGKTSNDLSNVGTSTLDVHVRPVVTAGDTVTYTPGGSAILVDPTVTVADHDNDPILSATVAITSGLASGDQLTMAGTNLDPMGDGAVLTASYSNGALVITDVAGLPPASTADFQAALQSITFSNTSANPDSLGADPSRTLTWTVNTGLNGQNSEPVTSTIDIPHTPPSVAAGFTADYLSNGTTTLDGGLTVSDVDSGGNLTGATVTIGTGFLAGDQLTFTNQNGISGSYDSAAGVLRLSGTATVAEYQTALQSVTYSFTGASGDATAAGADPTRTVDWVAQDGSVTNNTSTTATSTLDVLHLAAGGTQTYTAGGGAVAVDSGLVINGDANHLTGATVTIAGGFLSGDQLNFTNQNGISGSYHAASGTLVLSGTASVAAYQSALDSITYSSSATNSNNGGSDTSRTIDWVVNEGNGASNTASSTVETPHVAPVVTTGSGTTLDTFGTAVPAYPFLTVRDVDSATLAGATVAISSGHLAGDTLDLNHGTNSESFADGKTITAHFDNASGTLTLTGTASVADYQLALSQGVEFNTTVNATAARSLSWSVNDGSVSDGQSATASSQVLVLGNPPPPPESAPPLPTLPPPGGGPGVVDFIPTPVPTPPEPPLIFVGDLPTFTAPTTLAGIEPAAGGGEVFLAVDHGIADVSFAGDQPFDFTLPHDAFIASADDAGISFSATLGDGAALPSWLSFDGETGTFIGRPPHDASGSFTIVVTVHDATGHQAISTFHLSVGQGHATLETAPQAAHAAVAPHDFDLGGRGHLRLAADNDHRGAPEQLHFDAAHDGLGLAVVDPDHAADGHHRVMAPVGKPGLQAQLHAAGHLGFLSERQALIDSLSRRAG